MDLSDLIRQYCDDHLYGVSDDYRKQLGYAVTIFSGWLARPATVADLSKPTLNRYVDWLRESYAAHTARTQRGSILCLWRYAVDQDLTTQSPVGVRRLRMPPKRPVAWTPREVYVLEQAAARVSGRFRGSPIRRGPNLRALVLTAWDTGFRLGDLLRLAPADVISQTIAIDQHKTGVPVTRTLYDETWLAVACTVADQPERLLIWPLEERTYQDWIQRLREKIPVRPGSMKWIRRAVATACEASQIGDGTRMLGHLQSDTAVWYLDRAQLDRPFQPPRLADAAGAEDASGNSRPS